MSIQYVVYYSLLNYPIECYIIVVFRKREKNIPTVEYAEHAIPVVSRNMHSKNIAVKTKERVTVAVL